MSQMIDTAGINADDSLLGTREVLDDAKTFIYTVPIEGHDATEIKQELDQSTLRSDHFPEIQTRDIPRQGLDQVKWKLFIDRKKSHEDLAVRTIQRHIFMAEMIHQH